MDRFTPALNAIQNLFVCEFSAIDSESSRDALVAKTEIEHSENIQKKVAFLRHFLPLRQRVIALLAETYRKLFKLALAHVRTSEDAPENWAWIQLQPAVSAALVWIEEGYVLACDGENQSVRHIGSLAYEPGQTASISVPTTVPPLSTASWRAPAWLFGVSIALFGVGRIKEKNVPSCDSKQRLGVNTLACYSRERGGYSCGPSHWQLRRYRTKRLPRLAQFIAGCYSVNPISRMTGIARVGGLKVPRALLRKNRTSQSTWTV